MRMDRDMWKKERERKPLPSVRVYIGETENMKIF